MTDDSPLQILLTKVASPGFQTKLEEVRSLCARVLAILLVGICIGFYFASDLINFLKGPLRDAIPSQENPLHFTGPLEVMLAYMKIAFLVGIAMAAPYGLYGGWKLATPWLKTTKKNYVPVFFVWSLTLFILGSGFGYIAMLPIGLKWLVGMGGDQATPVVTVASYVDLVVLMLLGFGIAFQLPLIIILFERLGIISEAWLIQNRKIFIIGILFFAAIITPSPDPLSQVALAAPMYAMFEASILIIRRLKHDDNLPHVRS